MEFIKNYKSDTEKHNENIATSLKYIELLNFFKVKNFSNINPNILTYPNKQIFNIPANEFNNLLALLSDKTQKIYEIQHQYSSLVVEIESSIILPIKNMQDLVKQLFIHLIKTITPDSLDKINNYLKIFFGEKPIIIGSKYLYRIQLLDVLLDYSNRLDISNNLSKIFNIKQKNDNNAIFNITIPINPELLLINPNAMLTNYNQPSATLITEMNKSITNNFYSDIWYKYKIFTPSIDENDNTISIYDITSECDLKMLNENVLSNNENLITFSINFGDILLSTLEQKQLPICYSYNSSNNLQQILNDLISNDLDILLLMSIYDLYKEKNIKIDTDIWIEALSENNKYKPLAEYIYQLHNLQWNDDKWNFYKFNKRKFTIDHLHNCIKNQFRQEYDELIEKIQKDSLRELIYANKGRINHAKVADLIYKKWHHKYVYAESKNKTESSIWYEFTDELTKDVERKELYKYHFIKEPKNLYIWMSKELERLYLEEEASLENKIKNAEDKFKKAKYKQILRSLENSKYNLGIEAYQASVIKQSTRLFSNRLFLSQLDADGMVIGVKNGILLLGKTPTLIQGPSDYKVSKCANADYIPFDANNEKIAKWFEIIGDIFYEDDVKEFMWFFHSTGLDDHTNLDFLLMLIAFGKNGKSVFMENISYVLGNDYCVNSNIGMLTNKAPVYSPNELIMQLKGARSFMAAETDQSEKIIGSCLKSMIGSQPKSGRKCYGAQESFETHLTITIASNFDLEPETLDYGTIRRITVYEPKFTFEENIDGKGKMFKKLNPDYNGLAKNEEYANALFSILVHYHARLYNEYNGNINLVPRDTIKEETHQYLIRMDTLYEFITRFLIKIDSNQEEFYQEQGIITIAKLNTIAKGYIHWYEDNYGKCTKTIATIVRNIKTGSLGKLADRYGNVKGFRWTYNNNNGGTNELYHNEEYYKL